MALSLRWFCRLFLTVCLGCFVINLANAQGCQNQGCQRPSTNGNESCYTCSSSNGYACSLSGTCPKSSTETQCPPPAGGGGGNSGGGGSGVPPPGCMDDFLISCGGDPIPIDDPQSWIRPGRRVGEEFRAVSGKTTGTNQRCSPPTNRAVLFSI